MEVEGEMICPFFRDYTRMCVSYFKDVRLIGNYDFCLSDQYERCPFYKIMNKIHPVCEFVEHCPMYFHIAETDFDMLIEMTETYCFSGKHVECARYRLRKEGKPVPVELLPSGKRIIQNKK